MGRRKRREFTPEFKANAVRLVRDEGKSVREVVAEFDLTVTALRDWLRRAEVEQRRDPGGPLTTDERAEPARLEREFKTVSMERDFLIGAAVHSIGQGNASAKIWSGVLKPSVFRRRVFSCRAVLFSSACV